MLEYREKLTSPAHRDRPPPPRARSRVGWRYRCLLVPAVVLLGGAGGRCGAQDWGGDKACLKCHGDPNIRVMPDHYRQAMVRASEEPSPAPRSQEYVEALFVGEGPEVKGVHESLQCLDCHAGISRMPHDRDLPPAVPCGACHEETATPYAESLHGVALEKGDPLAPDCASCHGYHRVFRSTDPRSETFVMNIPLLCGRCHREGSEVQESRDIPQDHILENYSLSIHGEGIFRKGLTVTAVCTSCHTSHHVLPHTDPRSSISAENVSNTCMKCHAQIEQVHIKVIEGELWEKAPRMIPVCVDCHEPHKARKVFYSEGMSDADCLMCHGEADLHVEREGRRVSLYTDVSDLRQSAHAGVRCAQCHTGGTPSAERSCETIAEKVDCGICHADAVNQHRVSVHGTLAARGDPNAPTCRDCHGTHEAKSRKDSTSPIFPKNVPTLCGRCHREGETAAVRYEGPEKDIVKHYAMSIHGKGLLQSGLLVTANCVSCHTAHRPLPRSDPESSVHESKVAETCGSCHSGIYDMFVESVHSPKVTKTDKSLPQCIDCHFAHTISRADTDDFRLTILEQCGKCHADITDTYFDTYHGKVSKLGSEKTAKCQDCHGAHDILPPSDLRSHLSRANIVDTCKRCHPGSHRKFTGYLTHATHHDPDKFPFLWFAFWAMTTLLVGTLIVASLHTLAWLPASLKMYREKRKLAHDPNELQYRRFQPLASKLHFVVIVSFFGLAITGMALKFSYTEWGVFISDLMGGFESMGFIHRVCALLTFGYAGVHLWSLWRRKRESNVTWRKLIFDENSLMFNKRDWYELRESLKWFLGRGPRPDYGRWTYWEKFDYFAVFWGVCIIGSSGLVLWFPEFFTHFMPAQLINVATLIHSDEALLAVAFIFTIHFFNTHFRPDKFPIDTVIFTGRMPLEELKRDKPREYQEWVEAGCPEDRLSAPMPDWYERWAKFFGFTALATGLTLIGLIIYAMLFAYR